MHFRHASAAVLLALAVAGCEAAEDKPWVAFEGGGFVFNYRFAEAFYGFLLKPMRPLPKGTILEARFEDPAGGPELVVQQTVDAPQLRIAFQSPPVKGIVKDKPYRAEVRVLEAGTGKLLGSYARTYKSEVSQDWLPEAPLVKGNWYTPNVPPPQ